MKIAVIGAGIAGLSCAYELKKLGFVPIVFEQKSYVGGRMLSSTSDHLSIELGTQFLSSQYTNLINVIKELNLDSQLILVPEKTSFIINEKIISIKTNKLFSYTKLLGIKELIKFLYKLAIYFIRTRKNKLFALDEWVKYDIGNSYELGRKNFGAQVTSKLLNPLFNGLYFQKLSNNSFAALLAILAFGRKKSKTLKLKSGVQNIAKKLAEGMIINYNCIIESMQQVDGQVILTDNYAKKYIFNKVVIATPANITQKLYIPISEYENKLINTKYSSSLIICLSLPKQNLCPEVLNSYGILFENKYKIAAISLEHENSNSDNKIGINIMLGDLFTKSIIDKEQANYNNLHKIISEIINELSIIGDFRNYEIINHHIWQEAMPISYCGKAKDLLKYYKNLDKTYNIFLAGDYMGLPFSESACYSGIRIAKYLSQK